ncbi:hypothetical protein E2P86_07200 [Sphingobacterium psychroaquaticum]|uniref:outer membrane protein assembly factor BamB family protein n=1 Tax=Sphingobacterium psychroaquaticum TaxID=561061 RepID=UPI00106B6AE1|nr:PQQ-like beta-propeller repeat protein [Sphingobacterium psychroaquaticum]QBQ40944.1 hypothetical protein E2P86_07200 [Sphingobacterium psychroaquaticum]
MPQKSTLVFFLLFVVGLQLSLYAQQLGRTANRQNNSEGADIGDQLALQWKFQTKGVVYASPIADQDFIYIGSCDSNLYALHKTTGAEVWRFRSKGEIRSSVAIAAGLVLFMSTDGVFHAIDAAKGTERWSFQTKGERFFDTWDYYQSSPAVYDGTVYVGSGDQHIYALDLKSGVLRWRYKTDGIVHASPTVNEDAVFIGSYDGFFYCLEHSGKLRWRFKTVGQTYFPKGEVQFHAAVADSSVYFCSRDFNLYALHTKSGTGQWIYHQPGSWTCVPSINKSDLVVTMSDSFTTLVFNKEDGTLRHKPSVPLNVFSSPTIHNNQAYFGALNGVLYRLNLETGQQESIFQTDASKKYSADFFDHDGTMRKDLDARYQHDINKLFAGYLKMGSIFSTVWVEASTLYFATADGAVYAIK